MVERPPLPRRGATVLILAALSAQLAIQAGCASTTPPSQEERDLPPPPPEDTVTIAEASRQFLVVEPVGVGTAGDSLRAPARIEFREGAVAQLAAPFAGRVVTVHVLSGDTVRPGDPLVTLDCPDAANARAAVATVDATLVQARSALERQRRMMSEGVGIERERLEAESRVAELDAEAARARAAAAFAGSGGGTTVVVRAPAAGTVITRRATAGMLVPQAGEPLVEIGNRTALWAVADVFERDVARVTPGAHVRLSLPSVDHELDGAVVSVGAVVASGVRTAPVRIALATSPAALRPGMFGRADITLETTGALPSLPSEAVLIKGKDTIVYVETSPTTFARRPVTVSPAADGRVRILSGLRPGERIVVHGALLLDGSAEQLL